MAESDLKRTGTYEVYGSNNTGIMSICTRYSSFVLNQVPTASLFRASLFLSGADSLRYRQRHNLERVCFLSGTDSLIYMSRFFFFNRLPTAAVRAPSTFALFTHYRRQHNYERIDFFILF